MENSLAKDRTLRNKAARVLKTERGRATRRHPVIMNLEGHAFLKAQKRDRWPTQESEAKYAEMNKERGPKRRGQSIRKGQRGIRPAVQGFTLLDAVIDKGRSLDVLLTAASLKLKKVRRYPGYVLIQTYNLKNRPIEII